MDVLAVMEGIVPNTRFSAFTGDDLDESRAAVAELIVRADNAATLLSNMIAARKLDERYADHVTDLTAALARCRGEA